MTLAPRPLAGLSAGFVAGAAALGLLALWTLTSAAWSDATARALVEYQRVLAYFLAFVVLGIAGRSHTRVRWTLRALAVGVFVVCMGGLASRVLPDVVHTAVGVSDERLSYPVSYWNAMGLLAAIGFVLCLGLSGDARERRIVRVLGAAALPLIGATLLLTFSRGAIVAGAAGVVVLLVFLRSPALPAALLVALPTVGIAAGATYRADLLSGDDPRSAAATDQGHEVALVLVVCVLGAAAARYALLRVDLVLADLRPPSARSVWTAGGALAVLAAVVAVAAGAPAKLEDQYQRFVDGAQIADTGETRGRLTDPGNNGRLEHWRVALEAADGELLHGTGAGTYSLVWELEREEVFQVEDGHSLYLEVLGELGIVGLALVLLAVGLVLGGLARRARGRDRGPWAVLLAGVVAWALHAGVDWQWEMPIVTLWVFAVGGLALAAPSRDEGGIGVPRLARVVIGLALVGLAILPARLGLSQLALRDGARAFLRGDCATAIDRALDAVSLVDARPEPHVIVGYCDARLRRHELAVRALERAVAREPGNWENHYGLAVVRAAWGRDPRGSLNRAARLNPGESMIYRAQQSFASNDPEVWKRRAVTTRLPTD